MTAQTLEPGDFVCCPRCQRAHPAVIRAPEGTTPYEQAMLYVQCGRTWLYIGQCVVPRRQPVIEAAGPRH